eukprot:TRINITY_DN3805_c0_g1_i32.p2 TRINITY_DN3805_c0_g1~~TRINITY_DN3805_c0_g1_i32.p2  ORF type:complete len:131 (-),score=18.98 TRINITY_DN3805_c0_g1_i32:319-711(-)
MLGEMICDAQPCYLGKDTGLDKRPRRKRRPSNLGVWPFNGDTSSDNDKASPKNSKSSPKNSTQAPAEDGDVSPSGRGSPWQEAYAKQYRDWLSGRGSASSPDPAANPGFRNHLVRRMYQPAYPQNPMYFY